jgi:hypothetical protein
VQIDFSAEPGVGGGVTDLGFGQFLAGPVGSLFPFGNAEAQQQRRQSAQTEIFDAAFFRVFGQFNKSGGFKVGELAQFTDIGTDGYAGFDDVRAGENFAQSRGEPVFLI